MYNCITLKTLDEYFTTFSQRSGKGIFFYRIISFNEYIKGFLIKYLEAASVTGVVIEGKIQNPTEQNLEYYSEIMGNEFQMSVGFINASIQKWLPRLDTIQRENVSGSLYDTLEQMRREGKNQNMLKNAYIKFMCWLYYKFERILNQLGRDNIPKILYEGDISIYELKLLRILANAGCDIILLQYHGDQGYLKVDVMAQTSMLYKAKEESAFPEGFSIKRLRNEEAEKKKLLLAYGTVPKISNCTNAWITGDIFEDIQRSSGLRGQEANFYYNCFARINGVEDKTIYINKLLQLYMKLKSNKREVVVVEHGITPPTLEEIAKIQRRNYTSFEQMVIDLARNIIYAANNELQQIMKKIFVDILNEEYKKNPNNVNRMTNKAVYLLCWLRRYQEQLFIKWKQSNIAVFIYLGTCKNESEALFVKLLARLPVDVLMLRPNLNESCILEDSLLFEKKYKESMEITTFPRENVEVRIGTAAYHAEQELNTLMYQDTGMYREQQYNKTTTVLLKTIYEEIYILWKEEVKYRPNFNVIDNIVTLPVIFAKVCGVKDENVDAYWKDIKKVLGEDTYLITQAPCIQSTAHNPMKQYATEFFKNGKLQKQKILEHKSYQYAHLRQEIQEYILEKIKLLIEHRTIKGTFECGVEYTIVATLLNLNKDLLRIIQKMDFTKAAPKVVCINTGEQLYSLEDSILLAFLNLVGFDILIFTPTGYQNIEKHYNQKIFIEHQVGPFIYDLQVPDFDAISSENKHPWWREKLFRKGY